MEHQFKEPYQCKTHGYFVEFYIFRKNHPTLPPKRVCKICLCERLKRTYRANKEKINIRSKNWRKNNPEKVKEYNKRSYDKKISTPHSKELRKKYNKKFSSKLIRNLEDTYLRNIIAKRSSLKPKELPQSLVELKRLQIQLKRKIKEIG